MVAWNARQVFRDPGRLFQVPFYYPYSNGVAYQQPAFFTGLLAAPLLAAGAGPLLAVNLVLLVGLTASGALTYLLAYTITGRSVPSLIAGALFAFYPNRMDHLGQFTYQQAVLFPLVAWAAYRFVAEGAAAASRRGDGRPLGSDALVALQRLRARAAADRPDGRAPAPPAGPVDLVARGAGGRGAPCCWAWRWHRSPGHTWRSIASWASSGPSPRATCSGWTFCPSWIPASSAASIAAASCP